MFASKESFLSGVWVLVAACLFVSAPVVFGEDWPTDRHDNARSAVTSEKLSPPLHPQWTYRMLNPPRPSWPITQWNEAKSVFDRVNHVVVSAGTLYFGSSADGKVYALDANTGRTRWVFYTGGPVRVAPTVYRGKLYVTSDDGRAYCLYAKTGKLRWQFKGAPKNQKVLGHGKMISLWPMRTGVLAADGVAYFTAGLFPSEGIYIFAVDADTGRLVWQNDSSEAMYIDHPHPICDGFSGVPPQGPMVVTKEKLFIPTGRSVPAVFRREDGRFLLWEHAKAWKGAVRDGGSSLSLVDNAVFTSPGNTTIGAWAGAFDAQTGKKTIRTTDKQIIATAETYYLLNRAGIKAVDGPSFRKNMALEMELDVLESWYGKKTDEDKARVKQLKSELAAKRKSKSHTKWRARLRNIDMMILAGDVLYAGGQDHVTAIDAKTGKQTWKTAVEGAACGLAVSDGRLFASTDKGLIYCFDGSEAGKGVQIKPQISPQPYPKDALTGVYEAAADAIVKHSGIQRGYCLVLDGGKGRLAFELAKRTELYIVCATPGAEDAEAARALLDAAGLYGSRVTVGAGSLEELSYPDYFANLIVSDNILLSGKPLPFSAEVTRVLKPCGGTVLLGGPDGVKEKIDRARVLAWLKPSTEIKAETVETEGLWLKATRGRLPGAGDWTHHYGNAAGTLCSDDQLAKGPFEVLWFGEPGPAKSSKAITSPLSTGGRIFISGTPAAYDAYNGLKLWENPKITNINMRVATEDSLYVTHKKTDRCSRIDAATGKVIGTFALPPLNGKPHLWGYLAVDGELLFGTGLSRFALDAEDKPHEAEFAKLRLVAKYVKRSEGNIGLHGSAHQSIKAIETLMGEVDKTFTGKISADRLTKYKSRALRLMAASSSRYLCAMDRQTGKPRWTYTPAKKGAYICHASIAIGDGRVFLVEGRETTGDKTTKHLVTLDRASGKKLWETARDLTEHCSPGPILHRPPRRVLVNSTETLSLAYKSNVLVLGEVWGGRSLFALSAKDGKFLWKNRVSYNDYYRRRSMVVGNAVYTDSYAYNLQTGKVITRDNPVTDRPEPWVYNRSYGCGGSTASAHDLFFRSSVMSYFDLENDQGITNFSAVRQGCWINVVPASGLVLAPDMTRGCTCPYPIKTSLVLRPTNRHRAWSYIQLRGPVIPVMQFAVNLGAPGDRRDKDGTLWLGYPRPFHSRGLRFTLPAVVAPELGFYHRQPDRLDIQAEEVPWVFSSGVYGLQKITIPVANKGAKGVYTVRLYFAEIEKAKAGERVFDILIQGKPLVKNFDILKTAKGTRKGIVKNFEKIKAGDRITIELVSKSKTLTKRTAPVINGIKILRESGRGEAAYRKLAPLPPLKKPLVANVALVKTPGMKIDGLLNEPLWKSVETHTLRDNLTEDRPFRPTRFRVARTATDLVIGIECDEFDMENIRMKAAGGDDKKIWKDDTLEMFIGLTRKNCLQFAFNPGGAWCDINWNLGRYPKAVLWNSSLRVAASRNDKQWIVEAAIPLAAIQKQLGVAPAAAKPWKFNLFRTCRFLGGGSRYCAWCPTMGEVFRDPGAFGAMVFK